jgi:hypothetical protein
MMVKGVTNDGIPCYFLEKGLPLVIGQVRWKGLRLEVIINVLVARRVGTNKFIDHL